MKKFTISMVVLTCILSFTIGCVEKISSLPPDSTVTPQALIFKATVEGKRVPGYTTRFRIDYGQDTVINCNHQFLLNGQNLMLGKWMIWKGIRIKPITFACKYIIRQGPCEVHGPLNIQVQEIKNGKGKGKIHSYTLNLPVIRKQVGPPPQTPTRTFDAYRETVK